MSAISTSTKSQIRASDLPFILDNYLPFIKTLSLDCFDTLLWRKTATPKDVFSILEQRPLFQSLGITAHQRKRAAALAHRKQFAKFGNHEIKLQNIYENFITLNQEQRNLLIQEELLVETENCYGFPPFAELIRKAHAKALKIIVVSNIYLEKSQLQKLLEFNLPKDVFNAISMIFCSTDFGKSKKEGLFDHVLQTLSDPAHTILHIGDHQQEDFEAPIKKGINALHFIQFDSKTTELLRLQHSFAPLANLADPLSSFKHPVRYSPFRGLFATKTISQPEAEIGYLSFGPILFAFARFIENELEEMKHAGKKPKVFFLLRDAYLLYKACEAYSGKPMGDLIRVRKFVSVASSFKTRADVDEYLSGIEPKYFHFGVICEQLLLSNSLASEIIKTSYRSENPLKTFNELIHSDEILQYIFQQSAALRDRFLRYIKKNMKLTAGDTLVLVDTGFMGVTQQFLMKILKDEFNIEIIGLYFIASHDPNRPPSKALITSSLCDHSLFEQSCTYQEGAVLDYDNEGNPIFDKIRLSEEQYARVSAIQSESLQFIQEAKQFFSEIPLSTVMLQENAMAALRRHIYFPTESEIKFFEIFQHDKDMGLDSKKTMYNINNELSLLRQNRSAFNINPYTARVAHTELALSSMLFRIFDFDFFNDDLTLQKESLKIIMLKSGHTSQITLNAPATHDGFFLLSLAATENDIHFGVMFGQKYKWLQIDSVKLLQNPLGLKAEEISQSIVFNQMIYREDNLIECPAETSYMMIKPLPFPNPIFQIIFRPIVKR